MDNLPPTSGTEASGSADESDKKPPARDDVTETAGSANKGPTTPPGSGSAAEALPVGTHASAPLPAAPNPAELRRGQWLFVSFSVILVLSIIVYVGLHFAIRSNAPAPEAAARNNLSAAILQVQDSLTRTIPLASARAVLSDTVLAAEPAVFTTTMTAGTLAAVRKVYDNAGTALDVAAHRLPAAGPGSLAAIFAARAAVPSLAGNKAISDTLQALSLEAARPDASPAAIQVLLRQLQAELQPPLQRYFWSTGVGRWWEMAFWAWFGVLLYVLTEIYSYYAGPPDEQKFIAYTPWYVVTALKGPIFTLVIMFFLVSVSFSIAGVSFDLNTSPIELLIFMAAVLGFYSRVAKHELDSLVQKVLPDAWKAAQDDDTPTIEPVATTLGPSESQQFTVRPPQEVVWSCTPTGVGAIDLDGRYTAPEKVTNRQLVTITATALNDTHKFVQAYVVLLAPPPVAGPLLAEKSANGKQPPAETNGHDDQAAAAVAKAADTPKPDETKPAPPGDKAEGG